MGCETSHLQNSNFQQHTLSDISQDQEELFKIDLKKFIERQRGDILSLYHFSKKVSIGTAVVRKVLERNSHITRICKMKSVRNQKLFFTQFQQVEVLKNLNHPNIVQIIEYFIEHNYLYIILEDIPGKTLYQMLCEDELCYLNDIIDIMKQLIMALKFCHQKGYAHRAINPLHLMIVKLQAQNKYLVKLTGFGNSQRMEAQKNIVPLIWLNETAYIAPEVQNCKNLEKMDIWGCGIVFLNLITGQHKVGNIVNQKQQTITDAVDNTNMPNDKKQVVADFLRLILESDPVKRITASEALQHPIFNLLGRSQTALRQKQAGVLDRLLKFRVQSTLIPLFSMYATLNVLTVQEKAQHLVEFYNLDRNKDGKIDFNELVQCTQNAYNIDHNTAVQNVRNMFSKANKSEKSSIQFNEYLSATTFMKKQVFQESLIKIFECIDMDKDKVISKDQLQRAVGENNISEIFREFENKQLNLENFKDLMLQMFKNSTV